MNCTFTYCIYHIYHGNSWIKKWTLFIKDKVAGEYFFSPATFFIFKPLRHNTVQSASSNYYIYSFHTPFGKSHFPSIPRTSYHNQTPKQHHSHGSPLLSDLCFSSVWPFFQFLHFPSYRYFCRQTERNSTLHIHHANGTLLDCFLFYWLAAVLWLSDQLHLTSNLRISYYSPTLPQRPVTV